jgi:hypothetical protein
MREDRRVPGLVRCGLLILALGLFADLAYHSLPELSANVFGSEGVRAHLVVFVGMLVVVSGLVQQGLAVGSSDSLSRRDHFTDAPR